MKKAVAMFLTIICVFACMCMGSNASEPDILEFEPVPADMVIERIPRGSNVMTPVAFDEGVEPNSWFYEYERTTEYLGEMYFPNNPVEVLHNYTSSSMQVTDTWKTVAAVKVVGSIEANMEDYFKANYGFDYSFSKEFSRTISTTLAPGKSLKIYVSYATYLTTEIKKPKSTINDPSTYTTKYQYVHKPVGLMYTN